MRKIYRIIFILAGGILCQFQLLAQSHPGLILTEDGLAEIQAQIDQLPLLKSSLELAIQEVDADIAHGIDVPVPRDMAGGYTHERHKKNFLILQKAGLLYQITEDEKYAAHVRDVFLEYARQYPSWGIHPAERSYAPGRIFWQCLNDANWLVYMSQAYDCIYDFLDPNERELMEQNIFKPLCNHISVDSPQFFNRIHNHSTWGNAGVGMMGLVMHDRDLIERSLYGLETDTIKSGTTDDDGGLIKLPGQAEAGFMAQIDHAFSPDGFYTEGPYYQRYAMSPFLLYAQSLENYRPEMEIFAYRDSVLKKAVYVLLNLTTSKGEFFPMNDAQKGMSWLSRELVSSVNIIYHNCGRDPMLLSIAQKQNRVLLDDTGLSVAQGLKEGKAESFLKHTMELKDGRRGDEGAVGILRAGSAENRMGLVMKYTGQGLSHGHYDKLSFMLYNDGKEVIQDYGLARFVNIEQKYGGGYLPENKSWAKQTIAHNTLTVNQQSHFDGAYKTGSKYHSDPLFFEAGLEEIQIASARDLNAYKGVEMFRTMALIHLPDFEAPLVLDLFRVKAEQENLYDFPFYFKGQIMSTNFDYQVPAQLAALGKSSGYQHLWLEGAGKAMKKNSKLSWLSGSRFHTLTTVSEEGDSLLFTRIGAGDPNFNLRRDPAFMIRKRSGDALFATIIETHGQYSPVSEISTNSFSNIENLEVLCSDKEYTALTFNHRNGNAWILIISNLDTNKENKHKIKLDKKEYSWTGPYLFRKF